MRPLLPRPLAAAAALLVGCALVHEKPADRTPGAAIPTPPVPPGAVANTAPAPSSDPGGATPTAPPAATSRAAGDAASVGTTPTPAATGLRGLDAIRSTGKSAHPAPAGSAAVGSTP